MEKIVFEEEVNNTGIICQFLKTETGYIRKQIFPDGLVMEGDYTEEEYHQFLESLKLFKSLQEKNLNKKKQTKK